MLPQKSSHVPHRIPLVTLCERKMPRGLCGLEYRYTRRASLPQQGLCLISLACAGLRMLHNWELYQLPLEFEVLLTPDGRHVFLELNPSGEFFWLQRTPGLAVSDAIADLLTHIEKEINNFPLKLLLG